jgi:hypothetical protein
MRLLRLEAFVFVALMMALSFSSCEDFGGPPPRIIPGVSVDGVRLGDSKERVVSILGKPDRTGWADGVWRTWRTYLYDRPERFSIVIQFIDNLEEYGPVDAITVSKGYAGTSRDGIGIGSSRAYVDRFWGRPRRTLDVYAVYCFEGKFASVIFDSDKVARITIGYFVPCPADTFQTCN